jgi:ribosomal-protein-alanine N-acetyltransferase
MFTKTLLRTERLVLRPLAALDAGAVFALFSDPEVMRYWSCAPWTGIAQADHHIASAAEGLASGGMLRLGVELAATGDLVGQISMHHFDQQNRRCDVGYALARAHWGRGYLGEALGAVLEHGFGALALNRVEADVDPRNAGSTRLLERMGFEREGLLRERWIVAGEMCDTAFYGLLKRDWEARRPPQPPQPR